ncbi:hypothetical protein ACSSS7_000544 [Eimeria intestinalis]
MSSKEEAKKHAAVEAVNTCVRSGMRVGLGTGSTATFAVRRLAERLSAGELSDITCAATSEETRRLAESLGVSVQPLDSLRLPLDIAIDGADEIFLRDNHPLLLLLRLLSSQVADADKVVDASRFGTTGAVPVEVVQFGALATRRAVLAAAACAVSPSSRGSGERGSGMHAGSAAAAEEAAASLGVSAKFRQVSADNEAFFVSDNGNYCLDLFFKHPIPDPQRLHDCLIKVSGKPHIPEAHTLTPANSGSSSWCHALPVEACCQVPPIALEARAKICCAALREQQH